MRPLLLAVACWLVPTVAAADFLEIVGSESTDASQVSHDVDVTVEDGVATLRVDRTIRYDGKGRADVLLTVDLPLDGVITSAKLEGKGEVEIRANRTQAQMLFKDVKGRSKRRITYRVEVPLLSEDDEATIWLPQAGGDFEAPAVRFGGEVLVPEDNPAADPVKVPTPTPSKGRARWGMAELPSGVVWRLEVDAPHSLGESRDDDNVLFLLDVSRSQGKQGIERQLRLLQTWARQMPKARYQVVAYHRDADVVFATWRAADGVRDLGVGHPKLVPQNGSDLDAALQVAASLVKKESGSTVVLVGSDGETAVSSTPAEMAGRMGAAGKDAVVHLILTSGRHTRGAIETRADSHRLAPVALQQGGIPMSVYLPEKWPEPPEEEVIRNLLQPVRIDRFDASLDGKAHLGEEAGTRLYEHKSAVVTGRADRAPKKVQATGLQWGKRWSLGAVRTPAVDRRAALFGAFQDDVRLTDSQSNHLAKKYKFVGPTTLMRATRSGFEIEVAPSRLDEATGAGPGGASSKKRGGPIASELPEARVRELFASTYQPCVDSYRGPAGLLSVSLEMSWNEILDVSATGADTATNLCIEEAVWSMDLPDNFRDPHAFGMVDLELSESERSDEDGGDDGPPETDASKSGGCRVAPGFDGTWALGLLLFGLAIRQRRM